MSTMTCMMITTTVRERYHLQRATVHSIEKASIDGQLDQKVMSVDVVDGHSYEPEWFQQYLELGWQVIFGPCSGHRGMANNMLRGLQMVTENLLFYCEDDVIIQKIPSKKTLDVLFNTNYGDCRLGALVYNTHVLAPWVKDEQVKKDRLKYINDRTHYDYIDDSAILVKGIELFDEYWICFPAGIFHKHLFHTCLNYAQSACVGMGMEPAMSKAWDELRINENFRTAMYLQEQVKDKMGTLTFQDMYDLAQMRFWNNDESLQHPSWNDRKNTIF